MASLKGNNQGNTGAADFEQPEDDQVETTADTPAETVTEAASAETAVAAVNAATALTASRPKLEPAFAAQNGYFPLDVVESLSLAVPRIKGEQGCFYKGTEDLGARIRFEPISFNRRWAVGTGTDDKEANEKFAVSYDGVTLAGAKHGGMKVTDYVNALQAEGYEKAGVSEYLDLFCFIVWTEKGGDIPNDQREMVLLQCSPTSRGAWTAFMTTRGLLEAKGIVKPLEIVEATAEKRISGNNKYTNFSFSAPKA